MSCSEGQAAQLSSVDGARKLSWSVRRTFDSLESSHMSSQTALQAQRVSESPATQLH